MKSGELARLARAWGVDGGQLSRELHRQEQELARPLPGAVARARCARLLDLAAEDAAQVTDPAKRAALRIKLAGETARLHGIAGGQGGAPVPQGPPLSVAEQIRAAEQHPTLAEVLRARR
jgi:hypothetical protein